MINLTIGTTSFRRTFLRWCFTWSLGCLTPMVSWLLTVLIWGLERLWTIIKVIRTIIPTFGRILRRYILRCHRARLQLIASKRMPLVSYRLLNKIRLALIWLKVIQALIKIIVPLIAFELFLCVIVLGIRNELSKAALVSTRASIVLLTSLPTIWTWKGIINLAIIRVRGRIEASRLK